MKRIIPLLCVLLLFLSGCAEGQTAATYQLDEGLDLDLTKLSGTMIYSEVFHMRTEPEEYFGKRVRIAGLFSAYENPETGEYYYNCVIPDATACCSQGLQFFPAQELRYPDDLPPQGAYITLQGTFTENEENLYMCSLNDAVIEAVEE